jgi:hypothetical protein
MADGKKAEFHRGAEHGSPYPVSRLAPAFQTAELAAEVARAESLLSARTGAKLRIIAYQIETLQAEARKILQEAREEQALTRAQCGFKRIPGHTYHLYRQAGGTAYFSMLAPEDWGGLPPHAFLGSYRLEADYSWTAAGERGTGPDTKTLVAELLEIGGRS